MAKKIVTGWQSDYREGYDDGIEEGIVRGRYEAFDLVIAAFGLEKTYEGKLADFEKDLEAGKASRTQGAALARLGDATPLRTSAKSKSPVRISEPATTYFGPQVTLSDD